MAGYDAPKRYSVVLDHVIENTSCTVGLGYFFLDGSLQLGRGSDRRIRDVSRPLATVSCD